MACSGRASSPTARNAELRELARYRRTLIEERAHDVQRLQKVLEGANICNPAPWLTFKLSGTVRPGESMSRRFCRVAFLIAICWLAVACEPDAAANPSPPPSPSVALSSPSPAATPSPAPSPARPAVPATNLHISGSLSSSSSAAVGQNACFFGQPFAPRLPVISRTLSATPSPGSIAASAPSRFASRRRKSKRSTPTTSPAPARRTSCVTSSPITPRPDTTTASPTDGRASRTPFKAVLRLAFSTASLGSTPSGTATVASAGASTTVWCGM
jgi:hypothetical protein